MIALSSRSIAGRIVLAIAAFAAGSATLLAAACGTGHAISGRPPAPADEMSATPSAAASPLASLSPSPSASPPTGPVGSSIAGLPGWLYYVDDDRLVRLTGSGVDTVLSTGGYGATVSPDGASIAFIDQDNVVVADRDGQHRRTVLRGSPNVGYEPAWSPDSQHLLAATYAPGGTTTTLGVITIASASFTPLAHQPPEAIHPLWSADGHHLAYATGTCKIGTADIDGGNARIVPVFGDLTSAANPHRRRSCDPYSVSPDGRLIAVNQHTGDQTDGDIGRDLFANTIIDTHTGNNLTLPVTGSITAILFQPNGDILVRTTNHLTLLNHDRTIKATITEPATVKNSLLLAYTPK